jgi:hypothetical protein
LNSNGVHAFNSETVANLTEKFPMANDNYFKEFEAYFKSVDTQAVEVVPDDVWLALHSFPKETGSGKDGLKAQHLLHCLQVVSTYSRNITLKAYSDYVNLLISGKLPLSVAPFLSSAPVIPLKKKYNGIRPIAIGEIWRRLTSKIATRKVSSKYSSYLCPNQLGVGASNGCEAIIHSVERLVDDSSYSNNQIMLKVDFSNAFNCIDRSVFSLKFPEIFKWVYFCYASHSYMYVGDFKWSCSQGVQQGDPLGPLLFFLALQILINHI